MTLRRSGSDLSSYRRVRVLQSVRGPAPTTNPYIVQLVDALSEHADVSYFSWRQGLLGRYDVLHVHWPEVMLSRDGRLARSAARLRFMLLLVRVRMLRTPIVRTVHNVTTHEHGDLVQRFLLGWFESMVSCRVLLSPATPVKEAWSRTVVIAHGHYIDWYCRFPPVDSESGRLTYFGLIRRYKGLEGLVTAFSELALPSARLSICGAPVDAELGRQVARAAQADSRVELRLSYVDDATLATEVRRAQVVALPYRAMLNSGAVLLALSLCRPVLVPNSPANVHLAREVGEDWVIRYEGDLNADVLSASLKQAESLIGQPDLSRRNWVNIAREHMTVYRHCRSS